MLNRRKSGPRLFDPDVDAVSGKDFHAFTWPELNAGVQKTRCDPARLTRSLVARRLPFCRMSRDSAIAYGVDPFFRLEVIELKLSTGDSVGNKKRKN